MKNEFTLNEVMFGNAMLLILVAGFTKITEQIFFQVQLKKVKSELASCLDDMDTGKTVQCKKRRKFSGKYIFVR